MHLSCKKCQSQFIQVFPSGEDKKSERKEPDAEDDTDEPALEPKKLSEEDELFRLKMQ